MTTKKRLRMSLLDTWITTLQYDIYFVCSYMIRITLQGTNISPQNGILKMIFLFPRWDMLIPWRVIRRPCFVKQNRCLWRPLRYFQEPRAPAGYLQAQIQNGTMVLQWGGGGVGWWLDVWKKSSDVPDSRNLGTEMFHPFGPIFSQTKKEQECLCSAMYFPGRSGFFKRLSNPPWFWRWSLGYQNHPIGKESHLNQATILGSSR